MKPQTPEMLLEEKQLREQLYAAVMALPEKQAKRIYARYYLGMRVSEIAAAEGVDPVSYTHLYLCTFFQIQRYKKTGLRDEDANY